jgi:hypothetical protein
MERVEWPIVKNEYAIRFQPDRRGVVWKKERVQDFLELSESRTMQSLHVSTPGFAVVMSRNSILPR